jgi:HK97 family phage major capsid protein/HK97 family phage prohead protease
MNRAYAVLDVKSVDEEKRVIRGVATTPTPDRVGDIVEPLGVEFKNPLPLLWQHKSDKPVGTVTFDKPTKSGITFEAKLPVPKESQSLIDRVSEAWESVKLGLVRGVSIGFRPLEYSFMDDGGVRFVSSEVMELSLVTIPANADANIQTIKSIDAPLLAATGKQQKDSDRPTPPAPGKKKSTPIVKALEGKTMKKTYAEQIASFEATRAAKAAEMDGIMEKSMETGETLDAEAKETYDTLEAEVKALDDHIVRLRAAEERNKAAAVAVAGTTAAAASETRSGHVSVQTRKPLPKGYGFVRLLGARYMAKEYQQPAWEIAKSKGWGDDIVALLRLPHSEVIKAAMAPATTTDSTWAGPLVTYNNLQEEFIELLRPLTVIERIPGLRRVPFNIKVPRETGATTAYWVGQGSPKPLSQGAFDTVTLDFSKIAGITTMTQELLKFSRPNAEPILINSLTKAIAYLMDRDFLDPSKAVSTGVSPASITNGAGTVTATGTTTAAFRTDFGTLISQFSLNNNGSLADLVIVMSQTQALRLALMRNDFGSKEFPDLTKDGGSIEGFPVVASENIVGNGGSPTDGWPIVAMRASDILLADDGAVDVDISTEASLQMDNAPDSPNTASTVMMSLWQNNLVGIRCERFINWVKARTTSVYYITGGNYRE